MSILIRNQRTNGANMSQDLTVFGNRTLFLKSLENTQVLIDGVSRETINSIAWNVVKMAGQAEGIAMADSHAEIDGKVYKESVSAKTMGRAAALIGQTAGEIKATDDTEQMKINEVIRKLGTAMHSMTTNIENPQGNGVAYDAYELHSSKILSEDALTKVRILVSEGLKPSVGDGLNHAPAITQKAIPTM